MKKLNAFITMALCWSLFTFQLQVSVSSFPFSIGTSTAVAQDDPTETPEATPTGTGTAGPIHLEEQNKVDYMAIITMLSIGLVGMTMIRSCTGASKNPDVVLFYLGAAAFIAGEIIAFAKYKNTTDQLNAYNAAHSKNNADAQKQALEDLKKSYQDIKSTANTKRIMQIAAGVAFLAAAVVAAVNHAKKKAASTSCENAMRAAQTQAKSIATANSTSNPTLSAACTRCDVGITTGLTQFNVCGDKENAVEMSMINTKAVEGLLTQADSGVKGACTGCPAVAQLQGPCKLKMAIDRQVGVGCKFVALAADPWNNFFYKAFQRYAENLTIKEQIKALDTVGVQLLGNEYAPVKISALEESMLAQGYNKFENNFWAPSQQKKDPLQEYVKYQEQTALLNGRIQSITVSQYHDFMKNFSGVPEYTNSFFTVAMSKGFDLLVPQTEASEEWYRLYGIGALGVGMLVATSKTISGKIDLFMSYPKKRAYIWAAMAGLVTGTILLSTNKQISKAEENIAVIDKALKQYAAYGDAGSGTGSGGGGGSGGDPTETPDPNDLPCSGCSVPHNETANLPPGQSIPPVTDSTGAQVNLQDAVQTTTQPLGSAPGATVDPAVTSAAQSLARGGQQLSGASTIRGGGALHNFGVAARQFKAVKSAYDKIKGQLDKEMGGTAKGDALIKDINNQMRAATLDALKQKGYSPASALSSGAFGPMYGAADSQNMPGVQAPANAEYPIDYNVAPVVPAAGQSATENPPVVEPAPQPEEPATQQEYNIDNQVNTDSSMSLWEVITHRYLKSAFPRFFQKKDEKKDDKKGPVEKKK
jgi:hypothetical protein